MVSLNGLWVNYRRHNNHVDPIFRLVIHSGCEVIINFLAIIKTSVGIDFIIIYTFQEDITYVGDPIQNIKFTIFTI